MAESAGRYCPLCGEAAGLLDRFCRRCGEGFQVSAPGVRPATAAFDGEPIGEEPHRRSVSRSRRWQKDEDVDPER